MIPGSPAWLVRHRALGNPRRCRWPSAGVEAAAGASCAPHHGRGRQTLRGHHHHYPTWSNHSPGQQASPGEAAKQGWRGASSCRRRRTSVETCGKRPSSCRPPPAASPAPSPPVACSRSWPVRVPSPRPPWQPAHQPPARKPWHRRHRNGWRRRTPRRPRTAPRCSPPAPPAPRAPGSPAPRSRRGGCP